ncbi:MAG: type II secretion system F family protein [Rhodanobacter sp.]
MIASSSTVTAHKPAPQVKASSRKTFKQALDNLSFSLDVRSGFYTAMADFSDAGVAPYAALQEMLGVARDRWMKRSLVKVYVGIMDVMKTGVGLPAALAPWIPSAEASMLRGAQEAGPEVLNQAFNELGGVLKRQAMARNMFLKVIGMNTLNLIVMLGVLLYIIFTLVPETDKLVTPAMEPKMAFAAAYFAIGEWLISYGLYLLGAVILAIGGVIYALPNWASKRRRVFDQYIPPFSIYQRFQATMFLSSTASMMRAGITLNSVLEDLAQYGSKWMRFHVRNMQDVLDAGLGDVKALSAGPLPNDTSDTLRVYRLIPNFRDVMSRLSEANFKSFENSIVTIAFILEMSSMLLMTAFGAATVYAMFQFSDAIKASAQAAQQAAGG